MRTVIVVPVEGPPTADAAVKKALNMLCEFFREAEQVAEFEKDRTFKAV